MSEIKIIPYEGFDNIRFSDNRENVRKVLGAFTEFKKSKFSKNTTDDFGFCHVFYTIDNKVTAIEFFSDSDLCLNEKHLFSLNYSELKDFLSDSSIEEDDSGAKFPKFGISVYAPDLNAIETILVYSKDYWN